MNFHNSFSFLLIKNAFSNPNVFPLHHRLKQLFLFVVVFPQNFPTQEFSSRTNVKLNGTGFGPRYCFASASKHQLNFFPLSRINFLMFSYFFSLTDENEKLESKSKKFNQRGSKQKATMCVNMCLISFVVVLKDDIHMEIRVGNIDAVH